MKGGSVVAKRFVKFAQGFDTHEEERLAFAVDRRERILEHETLECSKTKGGKKLEDWKRDRKEWEL